MDNPNAFNNEFFGFDLDAASSESMPNGVTPENGGLNDQALQLPSTVDTQPTQQVGLGLSPYPEFTTIQQDRLLAGFQPNVQQQEHAPVLQQQRPAPLPVNQNVRNGLSTSGESTTIQPELLQAGSQVNVQQQPLTPPHMVDFSEIYKPPKCPCTKHTAMYRALVARCTMDPNLDRDAYIADLIQAANNPNPQQQHRPLQPPNFNPPNFLSNGASHPPYYNPQAYTPFPTGPVQPAQWVGNNAYAGGFNPYQGHTNPFAFSSSFAQSMPTDPIGHTNPFASSSSFAQSMPYRGLNPQRRTTLAENFPRKTPTNPIAPLTQPQQQEQQQVPAPPQRATTSPTQKASKAVTVTKAGKPTGITKSKGKQSSHAPTVATAAIAHASPTWINTTLPPEEHFNTVRYGRRELRGHAAKARLDEPYNQPSVARRPTTPTANEHGAAVSTALTQQVVPSSATPLTTATQQADEGQLLEGGEGSAVDAPAATQTVSQELGLEGEAAWTVTPEDDAEWEDFFKKHKLGAMMEMS